MSRRITIGAIVAVTLSAASQGCRTVRLAPVPPSSEIETTLLLIGDAGETNPRDTDQVLRSLRSQASEAPERTVVVFLGDNVYPEGVPQFGAVQWADSRRRLTDQINAVPAGAQGLFVPGNHDWAGEGPYGLYSVRLQEGMIATLAQRPEVRMLPGNGCPGPSALDFGRLRLVLLDTQWWLHKFLVRDSATKCTTNVGEVTAQLRKDVQPPGQDRVVVVGAHHPLLTGGEHGGYCGVVGPFRRFGGANQDIISGANRTMRDSLQSAFASRPPLIFASGHDHDLQVLRAGPRTIQLISGAGSPSKSACAVHMRETYYAGQHSSGFMRVDIMRGKGVLLRVYSFSSRGVGEMTYERWLEPR
jgi:hypothetical protein